MRGREEHYIQSAIVQYLRTRGYIVFAIPNGGARDVRVGRTLKQEGVLAGASDLMILCPGRPVFVEVKTGKGRQSPAQKDFQRQVTGRGADYFVWRDLSDAVDFVKNEKGTTC